MYPEIPADLPDRNLPICHHPLSSQLSLRPLLLHFHYWYLHCSMRLQPLPLHLHGRLIWHCRGCKGNRKRTRRGSTCRYRSAAAIDDGASTCGIILQHARIVGHIDRVCGNIRATDGYRCSNVISHAHGACAQCNHYICRLCINLSKLQA